MRNTALTYTVPEIGVKPSLLNEVPHHLGVPLPHCIVETAFSIYIQVKLVVPKFGHEVLDNPQVASSSSKVESIQKMLNMYKMITIELVQLMQISVNEF